MVAGTDTGRVVSCRNHFRKIFQEGIADDHMHAVVNVRRIKRIDRNMPLNQRFFRKEMLLKIAAADLVAQIL